VSTSVPATDRPAPLRRRRSLRWLLSWRFVALASLPLLLAVGLWAVVAGPPAMHEVERRNEEVSALIRDQIGAGLAAPRAALHLAGALLDGGPDALADAGGPQRLLERLLAKEPTFEALYLVGDDGRVQAAALRPSTGRAATDLVGLDFSARPFFADARSRHAESWSDTFLSPFTGQVTAALATPVGRRMLVGDIALSGLATQLRDSLRAADAAVIVLDGEGRVIMHPEQELAAWQENLRTVPLVQAALRGDRARGDLHFADEDWVADANRAGPAGWVVVVAQPRSRLYAPLLRVATIAAIAVGAALLMAIGFSLLQARSIADRYRRVAEAAQSVAEGDAEAADDKLDLDSVETQVLWERLHTLLDRMRDEEQRADRARGDLQAVLDAATEVSIIATDTAGVIRLFNRGAAKMLGWPASAVVGQAGLARFHDARELESRRIALEETAHVEAAGDEVLVATARRAGYEVRDWTYVRRDRTRLRVSVAVTAVRDDAGELSGFLHIAIDQTERQRARELEVERARADAANRAKSEFLSRVSHELRTPLNAMLGFAQLLARDPQEPLMPTQQERLRRIESAGWHLLQLIDDVLDLSRIEAGEVAIRTEAIDVREAVLQALPLVAPQAQAQHVRVIPPPPGAPLFANADRTRLRQVLVNLLGNGVKYTPIDGEVHVALDARGGTQVAIVVRDTGRGMSPEQLARLFTPFDRLGLEASTIPGTGIGLVISRRLVELMGGRLEVRSGPEEGSAFTVLLPAATPEQAQLAPAPVTAPPSRPAAGGDVVYVEDSATNLELMRAMFALRPACRLHDCETLRQARELVARLRPRLVLADLHVADGSGLDLIAWMHEDPVLARIPVVVVSADAGQAAQQHARALGAAAYLTKPVHVDEMMALLDELLAGPRAGAGGDANYEG
jgi:PAS domain S-box-containing protein